jgi:quercetin 2,3-dioxygenase
MTDQRAPATSPVRLDVRPAAERGRTETDWLDSRHTFRFGGYFDPRWHGYGALRVINDDRVVPGAGFPTHGHRDMEILTFVLSGALEHRDSTGGGGVLRPGGVQVMSAGRGIQHSEFNHSKQEPVHFLQVWIEPDTMGGAPAYRDRHFGDADQGRWLLVASRDGADGSLPILQDARVYTASLAKSASLSHDIGPRRRVWLHVATGEVDASGRRLAEGDGAYSTAPGGRLTVTAHAPAKILLFDLG